MNAAPKPELHVAVAVLRNAAGEVLISRRAAHVHQGGLWEFPGGKVEPGETLLQALRRELHEELGIEVVEAGPLIRIPHEYDRHHVVLDVWDITRFEGEPHGREGQPVAWVRPDALQHHSFPAANRPIVTAVRLPPFYLITGAPASQPETFMQRLEAALKRGIRLAQLRASELDERDYRALAQEALALCRRYQAKLLLNSPPELAMELDADGVHLSSARLMALKERPLPAGAWVAASCHDERQVRHACAIGVDFVVVSPVLDTASHPGAKTLGWEGLHALTELAAIPAYALGGMKPDMLEEARRHGAQGIAAISALWGGER